MRDRESTDVLVVRSRSLDDIKALVKLVLDKSGIEPEIIPIPDRDYAYRFYLHRDWIAPVIASLVLGIHYTNFKAHVDRIHPERHNAYFNVWSDLLNIDPAKDESRAYVLGSFRHGLE